VAHFVADQWFLTGQVATPRHGTSLKNTDEDTRRFRSIVWIKMGGRIERGLKGVKVSN
jgi:hypothetical protein